MANGERTVRIKFDGTAKGLAGAVAETKAAIKDVDRAEAAAYAEQERRDIAAERALEQRGRMEAAAYAEDEKRAKAHEADLIRQGKMEEAAFQEDIRRTKTKQRDVEVAARARAKAEADAAAEIIRVQKEVADRDRENARLTEESNDRRSKSLSKLRSKVLSIGSSIASKFSSAALGASGLNTLIGTLSGVVAWAGAASGALGLIPGAIAAGAAGMITWKLGADGIKKAFEGTEPTLDRLKDKVSGTFRTALAPAVRDVNAILPQTTGHLQGIAGAISTTIDRFTAMARQKSNTDALNSTLDNSAGIIRNVGRALAPLGQAFLDLAQVGSGALQRLTGGAGSLAQRFADFIRQAKDSGKIDQWIQSGLDAFKDLWGLLSDVWDIAKSVFGALREGGAGVAPILGPAIETVKRFVESPQGQETFRTLGELLSRIGDAVSRVLEPALKAVAPLIEPMSKLFGDVADELADSLGPAMEQLGDIAGPLMAALGPIVRAMVDGLTPVLPAIIDGIRVLGAVFVLLTPIILGAAAGFSLIVGFIMAAIQALTGDFVGAGKTLSDSWSNSMNIAGTITNTNWTQMSADILNGTNSSTEAVRGSATSMSTDWGGALMGMKDQTSTGMAGLNGIMGTGMGQAAGIAAMGGQNASGQFGGAIMGMKDGANRGTGSVLDTLRGFISRIPDAMGDVGSLLFASGKALLQGLGRGIDNATGGLLSKVGSVVMKVRNFFPFSPAKTGPFSGRGWVLYSGQAIGSAFATGMEQSVGAARAAAQRLNTAARGGLPGASITATQLQGGGLVARQGGIAAAMAASSGVQQPGDIHVHVSVDGKAIDDHVQVTIDASNTKLWRAAKAGMGLAR